MIRRLVGPVAVLVAVVLAVPAGLLVAVLVHGRLPERGEVVPALLGLVVAALVSLAAGPAAIRGLRAGIPALRRAPSDIPRRIAEAAAQRLPNDELLRRAAEALRTGLGSPRVEIWVRTTTGALSRATTLGVATPAPTFDDADLVAAARSGVAGDGWLRRWLPQLLPAADPHDSRRAPTRIGAITDTGELLGLLVVGRPAGASGYDQADDDAMGSACRLLAAVLRNRSLTVALEATLAEVQHANTELAASRTRVVTAADAERRRIERDLHDGAQQHLLALAVTVGLVRQMVAEGDAQDEVLDILGQLGDEVRSAVGELRALAQGIYPALLIDNGLVPALRAAATRSPQPVQVVDERPDAARLPAAIEAALYFCCLEALQNATKHAAGAAVRIVLAQKDRRLLVDVTDDGPGFDPALPSDGMGRVSMADRLGAHGGTVAWESAAGQGAAVRLQVPIPVVVP